MMQTLGIPALYTKPAGGGAATIPQWVQDFVKEHGGPSLVAQSVPHPGLHGAAGGPGWAIDVTGKPEEMDRLAQFLVDNPSASAQLIHQSTLTGKQYGVAGGQDVSGSYYGATYGQETSMVHWAPSGPGASTIALSPNIPPGQQAKAKDSAKSTGEQLGKDIVTGVMEVFGLGELFEDPTQFALFKLFEGIMKIPGKMFGGQNGQGSGGSGTGPFGMLTNLLNQPFGALNSGSPENAPGEFIPALGSGGGAPGMGGLVTDLTDMIPAGPGQQGQQCNGGNLTVAIGQTGANADEVIDQVQGAQAMWARPGYRNMPAAP